MTDFTHSASAFIAEHRAWAGVILGLVAFGESLLVVGAFLPASVLLLAAGGLIAAGVLDAGQVIAFTVLGAILGDALSYFLGRRLGPTVLQHPWLARHGRLLHKACVANTRYGVLTLFLGRFGGPLRAFVPIMAGIMGMPAQRFHPANALSGIVWVAALLLPGYGAVHGLSLASSLGSPLTITVAMAMALVLALGLLAATLIRRSPHAGAGTPTTTACPS